MRRYHRMARTILEQYPLTVNKLTCVTIRYNIIFRVDAEEGIFALRISPNQHRTALQVRSEMQWVESICHQTKLNLACPLRTKDQQLMLETEQDGIPDKRNAVVLKWLYGTPLRQNLSVKNIRAFGQMLADLHTHSAQYIPDDDFMTFDECRIDEWGDLTYLKGEHPVLTSAQQAQFREVIPACMARLEQLRADLPRLYLIHADTTLNNVLVYRGQLALFDFDDCRWGHFAQDLAPPLCWLMDYPEYREAFLEGYQDKRPLPVTKTDLKVAMVHRVMWGLNFMMHNRMQFPEIVKNYAKQVEKILSLEL